MNLHDGIMSPCSATVPIFMHKTLDVDLKIQIVEESTILLRGFVLAASHPHQEILVLYCQPGLALL